ncbi:putative DNA-binding domain-containing protein [Sphingomonas xanthus]|nr:putative DNA-binding domain-containing protein [Sphingomonas xanthus]
MRPDAHLAVHGAIAGGPDQLVGDMFAGQRAGQLRALRAHANTISHARHVAMEDSYPRTRQFLGLENFHRASAEHLAAQTTLRRPLRQIGAEFAQRLDDPAAADLAEVEWAWLESHGASDEPGLTLDVIRGWSAQSLLETRVRPHPAARFIRLRRPNAFRWDHRIVGDGPWVLVTRPGLEVMVFRAGAGAMRGAGFAAGGATIAELLEADAAATTMLIQRGALTLVPRSTSC